MWLWIQLLRHKTVIILTISMTNNCKKCLVFQYCQYDMQKLLENI